MKLIPLACAALLIGGSTVRAQSPTASPAPSAEEVRQDEAAEKKLWAQNELEQARQRESALDTARLTAELKATGQPESSVADYLNAAQETVRNYQAASDLLTTVINNQRTLADLQKQPAPTPPKNEAEVDALRDKIAALRSQGQTADTQTQLDDALLAKTRSALDAADQHYRLTSDEFDSTTDPALARPAGLRLQLAELRQQAASSAAFLATWRLTLDELDQQTTSLNLRRLEKALANSGLDTVFSTARADAALARLAKTREIVRKQLDDTRTTVASLNATLSDLQTRLEAAEKAGRKSEINILTARRSVATEAANTGMRIVQACESWLTGITNSELLWQTVRAEVAKPDIASLEAIREKTETALMAMTPWRDQIPRYLQDIQRRLEELSTTPRSKDAETQKLEDIRQSLLQTRAVQLRDLSGVVENQFSVYQRMAEESRVNLAALSLSERGQQAVQQAATGVKKLWQTELFTVTDANGKPRPITPPKVLVALIGLLVGLAVAKLISRNVSTRVQRRFGLEPARGMALEKALYIPLLCLIILTILNWLSIPLTTFAFLGGALAIGVGFGAQTLVNNFISGIILIAERRIKVGDLIEVDTHMGTVMNLGTRCSRISKATGVEVLIPNSYLLEKDVTNWTLSDNIHRYDFTIGLGYNSDPEEVMRLLLTAVVAEEKVLKEPAPQIFFDDFGDSALIFHIYYHVNLRGTDNRAVGSSIRTRIAQVCRENKIDIPFPQREVRMFTSDPIDVRINGRNDAS